MREKYVQMSCDVREHLVGGGRKSMSKLRSASVVEEKGPIVQDDRVYLRDTVL